MTCSFTSDTDGYVYDLSGIPDGVPLPDDLPEPDAPPTRGRAMGRPLARAQSLRPDGTREATHRHWFRLPRTLDDDPHLHRRCSATQPTGPASAGGPSTSRATPPA